MTFVSYAQNFEDVMLWRALRDVGAGFYIDVGAAHPDVDSVTRAFYDRGWRGIDIEPTEEYANRLKAARPRSVVLDVAAGERNSETTLHTVFGTGLSTVIADVARVNAERGYESQAGTIRIRTLAEICEQYAEPDIHFLKVDVEGAERAVLLGADFQRFRPWLVLVEATAPMSQEQSHHEWEDLLTGAGYRFVWFDGLNRFYISAERHDELAPHFALPPNVFDNFVRADDTGWARRINEAEGRVVELRRQIEAGEQRAHSAEARISSVEDRAQRAEERALAAEAGARATETELRAAQLRSGRAEDSVRVAATKLDAIVRETAQLRGLLSDREAELASLSRAREDERAAHERAIGDIRTQAGAEVAQARTMAELADFQFGVIRSSTAWRMTAPVRRIAHVLRPRKPAEPSTQKPSPPSDPDPEPEQAGEGGSEPAIASEILEPSPQRPIPAVHQFHSGSAAGDAITNAMLLTRTVLRDMGFRSEIYVEHVAPELAAELRPVAELPAHRDYVLLHRHSFGIGCLKQVLLSPAQRVLVYHNITPPEFLDSFELKRASELGRRQLKQLQPIVVAALADSEFNAVELRTLGFRHVQACQILFDLDRLFARSATTTRIDSETFTVLFVGRIIESKGQADLVDAYAEFRRRFDRPARLVLVGRHDGETSSYVLNIRSRAALAGLSEEVLLTGLVADDVRDRWYAASDLYVSLSLHEGFGIPLVEAVASGIPVLALPCGAVPYNLGPHSEFLPSRDACAVAERMRDLAVDSEQRARLVATQREWLTRFRLGRQLPTLVNALALAGAQDAATPELRQALAAQVRFTVAGHLNGSYSLAAINRQLALAIEAERPGTVRVMPVEGVAGAELRDVPPDQRSALGQLMTRPAHLTGPAFVISQHYPVWVPPDTADGALALFFWEETVIPDQTVALLNESFSAVLAPTSFVAKTLIDSGVSVPVHVIGHAHDLSAWERLASERGTTRSSATFTFLHVSSCFPRKGVDVLLAAFTRAFRRGDPVRLVIKGFPNPHNDVADQIARVHASDPDAPEIVLIDREMSDCDLLALYGEADSVVLPTRGEGYNLPAAEAMAAGIPVITTGFGGHMDFCTPENVRLLRYRLAPSRSHLAAPHALWAEPDAADLCVALREAFAGRDADDQARASGRARIKRAQTDIACATDRKQIVRRMVDAAVRAHLAVRTPALRLAWVSSWDVRCGIAEYSRFLLDEIGEAAPEIVGTIFADRRTTAPVHGHWQVRCDWTLGAKDGVAQLAAALSQNDPDVIVIQHQPALFDWPALAALLQAPALRDRRIVVTLHNTRHLMEIPAEDRAAAVAGLAGVARVLVHTILDLDLLQSLDLAENVTYLPHGAARLRTFPASTGAGREVIGCFGFFLPGKGLPQLVEAFVRLRKSHRTLRLRLVNASYGIPESEAEIATCRAIAQQAGVADAVEFVTDFLPMARVQELLSQCDVIVLPYQSTIEASSAALRTALTSGVPVAVTPLPIFSEAVDATFRFSGVDPEAIEAGLAELLSNPALRADLAGRARVWLDERDWSRVGKRFLGMLRGLARATNWSSEGF